MIKFEVTVAEFLDRYKYRKKIEEHYRFKNQLRDLVLEPFYKLEKMRNKLTALYDKGES